ncbi:hypothetical protein ACHQM5_016471 [Ranunculus cassubicifolius]
MGVMDESFKRAGAVPFKWEVQPGIPKSLPNYTPSTPSRLAPPPSESEFYFAPTPKRSLAPTRSLSRLAPTRSLSRLLTRLKSHGSSRTSVLLSLGCFPGPCVNKRSFKVNTTEKSGDESESDSEYDNITEILDSWSNSPQKLTDSPLRDSASSSSERSSPPPSDDVHWAAFGLF